MTNFLKLFIFALCAFVTRAQFDLGDKKVFSMKVKSMIKVVKGEEKGCEGKITGCLFGCTRTFGEKITVELDCLKGVIEGNAKLKKFHGEEKWFDFGAIRPTKFGEPYNYLNQKKRSKTCSYKKCPVGKNAQLQMPSAAASKADVPMFSFIGCTGKVIKTIAPEGGNVVTNFLKKSLMPGDCEFEVDSSSKNYLGKSCKDHKALVSCDRLVQVPKKKKRVQYVTRCVGDLDVCPIGSFVQLSNNLGNEVEDGFWKNCYGRIAKGTKKFLGTGYKFKVRLDCEDYMVSQKNTCCWPGNHGDDPHLTGWISSFRIFLR